MQMILKIKNYLIVSDALVVSSFESLSAEKGRSIYRSASVSLQYYGKVITKSLQTICDPNLVCRCRMVIENDFHC